ncbi:MAG: hypothetical protein HC876_05800 [Chloroflexaceae bacterium]|nr:hypothetical protein [Chloroflexaceae bacterium]
MARFRRQRVVPALLLASLVLLVLVMSTLRLRSAAASDPITQAWQRVQAAGSYHFSSEVTQITTPHATVLNIGRSSQEQHLYMEGQTHLHERTAALRLWTGAGSVLDAASGLAVRIEDGKTWVREGNGIWQEADGFSDTMMPQGDFMAYLAAVRDVTAHAPETRAGLTFTRYTFSLDGPTLATYMRDQVAATMQRQGELPPGVQLEISPYYAGLAGHGELWIGEDGLPVRQQLELAFPEQHQEHVSAVITVDFSDFGTPQGWFGLPTTFDPVPTLMGLLSILLSTACALLLVNFRRSPVLGSVLAISLSLIIVLNPLLQQLRVADFLATQTARAAEQAQEQAEVRQIQTAKAQAEQQFDPHRSPLAAVQQRHAAEAELSRPPLYATEPSATNLQQVDVEADGTDTDGDGLTDYVEALVGTSATSFDTDGDLVTDTLEVQGFVYAGRTWYTDPFSQDTNNDSQTDSSEWFTDRDGDDIPDDTDDDGVPDLFDDDNDGDGVPDTLDLSPIFASRSDTTDYYTNENPLALVIEDLTPGKPTFVDFQIRPENPEHLWYATRVYDWPEDNQGQIQETDNKSLADVAREEGRSPSPSDEYGDMKLIPMLELTIMGGTDNLPPQDELLNYNILVNDLNINGQTGKAVYVPLSVVADENTGERVAFNGRMFYRPAGTWGQAQQVRLVWVVQVLIDECKESDGSQCATYEVYNTNQVVQSYYDSWSLTGMTVREDHGTEWGIVYEDPAVDEDLDANDPLWLLVDGLDRSFINGRDQDNDGNRDLTVAEIARRFDRTLNGNVSAEERWSLPNAFRVATASYEYNDLALLTTTVTETKQLLDTAFAPRWTAAAPIKPLLLHVHEENFRALSLDEIPNNTGYAEIISDVLTLDFAPMQRPNIPLDTLAAVQWSAYCGTQSGDSLSWDNCDLAAYWEELGAYYAPFIAIAGEDPEITDGRMVMMQLYFLAVARGLSSMVERDSVVQISDRPTALDRTLSSNIGAYRRLIAPATEMIKEVIKALDIGGANSINKVLIEIGKSFNKRFQVFASPFSANIRAELFKGLGTAAQVTLIVLTVVIVVIAIVAIVGLAFSGKSGAEIGFAVSGLIATLYSFIGRITKVATAVEAVRKLIQDGSTLLRALTASSSLIKVSARAEIGAAIIGAIIAIALFITVVVVEGLDPFGPTFNALLAQTIALIIYLAILTALSLTIVGFFIVAILALIDLLLVAICELGVDELRKVPGLNGACFSISGIIVAGIAKLIYAFDSMIDTSEDRTDMIVLGELDLSLADQQRGYVEGNTFSVNLPITTTVVHKDPAPENVIHIIKYLWLFSQSNIRSTTFEYQISRDGAVDLDVDRNEMNDKWTVTNAQTYAAKQLYRAQSVSDHTPLTFTLEAGINQSPDAFLNTGYALPAYECWSTGLLATVCYVRQIDGFDSSGLEMLVFDIFPDTLDEFAELVDQGDGALGLAWDDTFPSLQDADGDTLLSTTYDGIDPDDTTWDADGDRLADSVELTQRSEGRAFSPFLWDTDNDGLTDRQEASLGTNPIRRDTDNDGLEDGQEVYHERFTFDTATGTITSTGTYGGGWTMTISETDSVGTIFTSTVLVTSDPLQADGDGDGWNDLAEYQLYNEQGLPYHPLVANSTPVAVRAQISDLDGIVGPGDALVYTTTVEVTPDTLLQGIGVFEVALPGVLGGDIEVQQIDLSQAQDFSVRRDLTAANDATTQEVDLASLVRARLSNLSAAGWRWRDVTTETPLGGFTRPSRLTDIAPPRATARIGICSRR